jgi:hypothetical protein
MRALLTIAGLLLSANGMASGSVPPSGMPPSAPGKPLPAVCKEQHLDFAYAGRTSRYSCDNLREKMLALLLEMGVRLDLKISAVHFILTSDAFRNFSSADCELVREFARQILPKLATRDIAQDISCVPFQESGSRYVIRGEVLRMLPRNDQGSGYRDAAPAP